MFFLFLAIVGAIAVVTWAMRLSRATGATNTTVV